MKTLTQILKIVVLFFSIICYSQSEIKGKITYKYRIEKDIFDSKNKSENIKRIFNGYSRNLNDNKEKISFVLLFQETSSIYRLTNRLSSDMDKGLNFSVLLTGGNEEIYINKKNNVKLKKVEIFGQLFLVEIKENNNWILTQQSKMIGKYKCYKAVLNKKIKDFYNKEKNILVEAWFTSEIPVSLGPKGFGNLPGLILELHQGGIIFYADKIVLNPNGQIIIKEPKKGKKISEKEFSELFRKIDKRKRN